MGKFLDEGTWCLYLDQFAVSRVFASSPPSEWVDIAALIKQGISIGKLLYPNSIEQMIETAGMDKESATLLDSEARNFSSGWCFFTEADISANYLICRVRQIEMTKHHFIHSNKQGRIDESNVHEELGRRNEIFREMVKEGAEPANIIRMATRGGTRGTKDSRDVIVGLKKNNYAQEMARRMFWLGSKAKYIPRTITLAEHTILFWADVVCHLLVNEHRMTQQEAQTAFWILEKEGIGAIPSLSIRASLEAMTDYKAKIEISNDQVDIMRIAGALPFADIMVVDGSKASDVRELGLDKKFQTNVYSGKRTGLEGLKRQLTALITMN